MSYREAIFTLRGNFGFMRCFLPLPSVVFFTVYGIFYHEWYFLPRMVFFLWQGSFFTDKGVLG